MKYPFSPEVLDALPEELAELFRNLELTLLEEICSRLKIKNNLNEVTVQDIRALRSHGIPLKEIEKAIRETANISQDKLNKLIDDVVDRNQRYYTELIDFAKVTHPQSLVDAVTIDAIRRQTAEEFSNITKSLGFLVDSGRTKLKPAQAYQWALDNALLQIDSGAINYNEAIKNSVRQLADSGIRVVEYESGHMDHADVAARRAIMTGVSQLCAKYTEQSAEYLETDCFEISAHIGARDVEGPSPWSSHKAWQGKVYSVRFGDKYPNIYAVCGLGYVDGLEGANCRHIRFPFVDGVSVRTYTDEELEHIDDGHDCEYEGRHYSAYEATQKQREIERTIRKLKRREASYKAAGIKDEEIVTSIRRKRLSRKYKEFSKTAGLPEQMERTVVNFSKALAARDINILKPSTKELFYDPNANYDIKLPGVSDAVNQGLSSASKNVAQKGSSLRKEVLNLVNMESGEILFEEVGNYDSVGSQRYIDFLKANPNKQFAFVHNHPTDGFLSSQDMQIFASRKEISCMIATSNSGLKRIAYGNKKTNELLELLFSKQLEDLRKRARAGIINSSDYTFELEKIIVEEAIKSFANLGFWEVDGRA